MHNNLTVTDLNQNVYQSHKFAMNIKIASKELMRIPMTVVCLALYFSLPFEALYFFHAECCELLSAQYTDNNTLVYQEHPYIFTTYEKKSKNVRGRASYKSLNGKYFLKTARDGSWKITDSQNG